MTLHLSQQAFLSVVLSSVEAYKKECYGLILGYRTDDSWRVARCHIKPPITVIPP